MVGVAEAKSRGHPGNWSWLSCEGEGSTTFSCRMLKLGYVTWRYIFQDTKLVICSFVSLFFLTKD